MYIYTTKTHDPMIFEDMEVLATFMMHSFPKSSTLATKCSWMYLTAILRTWGKDK